MFDFHLFEPLFQLGYANIPTRYLNQLLAYTFGRGSFNWNTLHVLRLHGITLSYLPWFYSLLGGSKGRCEPWCSSSLNSLKYSEDQNAAFCVKLV